MRYIKYFNKDSIKDLPTREILCRGELSKTVDSELKNGRSILFHPNSVEEYTNYKSGTYELILYGILIDGRKITVRLDNFMLYFDIRKPSKLTNEEFKEVIGDIARRYDAQETKINYGKGFEGYERDPVPYATLYFNSKKSRESAMEEASEKYKTTSNETSQFHRVICKDNEYSLSKWNVIRNFRFEKNPSFKYGFSITVDVKNITRFDGDIVNTQYLLKDRMITRSWDIETGSTSRPGQAPQPIYDDDRMIGIGQTYHWNGVNAPIIKIMTVIGECDPIDGIVIIECKNERDLILATFQVNEMISPDLSIGFNSGGYDWPWIIERAKKYNILTNIANSMDMRVNFGKVQDSNTYKYKCRKHSIKLEAQLDADIQFIQVGGYVDIDISPILRKLHPKEIFNTLKHFLSMYKLAGKDDLSIERLMEIFADSLTLENPEKNRSDMSLIVKYCIQDCIATHNLCIKINVVNDMREIADLSRTSLYDAVYYAYGMKIINLVKYYAKFRNIYISSTRRDDHEKGKFPGAYVVSPLPKLYKPNLTMRERQLKFQEWKDIPEDEIKSMEEAVYSGDVDKYRSNDLFRQFIDEEKDRGVVALDLESLYPSIQMTYNICPSCTILDKETADKAIEDGHELYHIEFKYNDKNIEAWTIRHDTIDGTILKPGKTENKFGLLPFILKMLKDDRRNLKKSMKPIESIKKRMENDKDTESDEYHEVSIRFNYINSKQKALKVFMNTVYGVMGDTRQALYLLQNAAGVTSIGQKIIKNLGRIITGKGWTLRYGDTDSMYVTPPSRLFEEIDRLYYSGRMSKVDYCSAIVKISTLEGKKEEELLNSWLEEYTGTNMMRIAQEGTAYPCYMIAPKMYFYLSHEHHISFDVSKHNVVIHGLISIKRGTAMILVNISNSIVYKILDINVLDTPLELVRDSIKYIYTNKWDINDFKKNMIYKPDKKNVTAHVFHRRMNERGDESCLPPKPGIRFEFVIVRRDPFTYDGRGRKSKISMGDKIEYVDYAIKEGLDIDLDYYMSGGILGCIAQLGCCDPIFKTECERKVASKTAILLSKSYMENLVAKYSAPYECKGKIKKQEYKERKEKYKQDLSDYTHFYPIIYSIPTVNIFEYLMKKIEAMYKNSQVKFAVSFLKNRDTTGLLKIYNLILSMVSKVYNNVITDIRCKFSENLDIISNIVILRESIYDNVSLFDSAGIKELDEICNRLKNAEIYKDKILCILSILKKKHRML